MKCVFLLKLQVLSEAFSILRIEWDMISKMYIGLHLKYPLFPWDINENLIFFETLSKNTQTPNSTKICPVWAEFFDVEGRTDGWTDMTKLVVAFSSFANAPKKKCKTPKQLAFAFHLSQSHTILANNYTALTGTFYCPLRWTTPSTVLVSKNSILVSLGRIYGCADSNQDDVSVKLCCGTWNMLHALVPQVSIITMLATKRLQHHYPPNKNNHLTPLNKAFFRN